MAQITLIIIINNNNKLYFSASMFMGIVDVKYVDIVCSDGSK